MSTPSREELPLPDYDGLSVGELEHRIRSLSAGELETLVRYERAHAARVPVMELLAGRLGQLDAGATPSPGGRPPTAGDGERGRHGSPVTPRTSAEPVHPPPHGSPDQPAQPKGNRQANRP